MEALSFDLTDSTQLVFGSAEEGRQVLLDASDPLLPLLGEFETTCRCGDSLPIDRFMAYQADCVREWPADILVKHQETLKEMGEAVRGLQQIVEGLPEQISLYLTTGCEETRVPKKVSYCRGDRAIFVGEKNLKSWNKPGKMKRLLFHELWHIWSRNVSDDQIDQIYAIFGFKRIPATCYYPEEIEMLRYTNPDAMNISHYIDVKPGGGEGEEEPIPLVPLVFLRPYDLNDETLSPIDHITIVFGVLKMTKHPQKDKIVTSWITEEAQVEEGEAPLDEEVTMLIPPDAVPEDFWRQVSKNTGFILHVNEIASENFVMVCMKEEECDNPQHLKRMEELLK